MTTAARKLSPAQVRFLRACASRDSMDGYWQPTTYNRASVSVLSGWHRTAKSLEDRGLVRIARIGNMYRAFLTVAGEAACDQMTTTTTAPYTLWIGGEAIRGLTAHEAYALYAVETRRGLPTQITIDGVAVASTERTPDDDEHRAARAQFDNELAIR